MDPAQNLVQYHIISYRTVPAGNRYGPGTSSVFKVCKFTCHHTDSTIRAKIQDSIFSNAAVNVLVSCQSSTCCIKPKTFACLFPTLFLHFSGVNFPSVFFAPPFDSKAIMVGFKRDILPNVWDIISLSTTVFDSQKVNLE